jgi:hypothetical protein
MNQGLSVLRAGRQVTVPELTREERRRELERLARAEVSHPGVLPQFAVRIAVAALASDHLDGSVLDDAWLEFAGALRLFKDGQLGHVPWCGEGTLRARLDEALDMLLDGSKAA